MFVYSKMEFNFRIKLTALGWANKRSPTELMIQISGEKEKEAETLVATLFIDIN